MAISIPFVNKTAPLSDQLAAKASALRSDESSEAQAAKNYLEAARHAQAESAEAARKAAAVEQAHGILVAAGVTL